MFNTQQRSCSNGNLITRVHDYPHPVNYPYKSHTVFQKDSEDWLLTPEMMEEMEADAFGLQNHEDENLDLRILQEQGLPAKQAVLVQNSGSSVPAKPILVDSSSPVKTLPHQSYTLNKNYYLDITTGDIKNTRKRNNNNHISYSRTMAKDPVKDRTGDHRVDRDRSGLDRPAVSSRTVRDRGSSRDRDKERERDRTALLRDETPSKRLRNEGEPRIGGSVAKSESHLASTAGSSSSMKPPPLPLSSTVAASSSGSRNTEDNLSSVGKKELYENVVEFENNEAKWLDTDEGMTECKNICQQMEENFDELAQLKNEDGNDPDDLEDKMEDGLMTLMSLRRLNRLMKLKLKLAKEDQLGMRNEVDCDHLLLQNLLYEATHLQNQVAAVQDYKGMDEKIDLIPVNKFYEEAPQKISKPDVTKNDPHLLRIARLEFEFIQRQNLTEECSLLEKEKELVSKHIEEKQKKLDSIRPLLSSVLDATKPIQEFFGIDISSKKEQNQIAQFLPPELYVLLVQSNAFKEAGGDSKFMIHICGNVNAAKDLVVTPEEVEEDSDSDKEQDGDIEISERRLLRKKSSICVTPEDSKKKLVQKHPLWVEWTVKCKGGDSILIQFFYLIKLRIITVKAKVHVDKIDSTGSKPSEEEITSSDNLLSDLFPEDGGLESPNPANVFMFQKEDANGISDFVRDTGLPFKWAQRLGGLEFPSAPGDIEYEQNLKIKPKMQISAMCIENTLDLIRKRLTNQTKLWNQLKALDSKNIQIPSAAKDLFPPKTSTLFKSWESITWKNYNSYAFSRDLICSECVSDKHLFYKATLERGRAKIIALVALSLDFPTIPPVFCVELEQDGNHRNSTNDAAVRDLEKEVNVYASKEFEEWSEILVSLQLQRLIQCTDIILETDFILGESVGPSEFGREKLFLRAATGRNLRRPFKYFGTGGGYFSQRF